MNHKEIIKNYANAVDSELIAAAENLNDTNLKEPYLYFINNGGKRIRPVMTILAGEANGVGIEQSLANAVAIELLHNFTLIHDDIMDNSPLRRGKPTIHTKWDEATAILLGDIIIGLAYKYLTGGINIQNSFNKALLDVCFGQALDLKFNSTKSVIASDYFEMIAKKTSSLLITSTEIGSYLGDNQEITQNLSQYSYNLGIAFQLKDDLLDLTSDEAELGKVIGQDIVEGKKTYMILKIKDIVEDKGTEQEKQLIESFYRNNGLEQAYVGDIRDLMQKYDVLNDSKNMIEHYTNKSHEFLNKIPESNAKSTLIWLTDYLLERNF